MALLGWRKFQRDIAGVLVAGIHYRMGQASLYPGNFARLQLDMFCRLALYCTLQVNVADCYDKVRNQMLMSRDHGMGLKIGLRSADAILHKKDFLSSTFQHADATLFIPFVRRLRMKHLYIDIGKWFIGEIADNMREATFREGCLPGFHPASLGRFAWDLVAYVGISQRYDEIVVAMAVKQGHGMGRNHHMEYPHEIVLQHHAMRRFGGYFDFRSLAQC